MHQLRGSLLDRPTMPGPIPLAVPIASQTDKAVLVKATKGVTLTSEVPSRLSQHLISVRGVKVCKGYSPHIQATVGLLFRWAIGGPHSINGILSKNQTSDLRNCCSHRPATCPNLDQRRIRARKLCVLSQRLGDLMAMLRNVRTTDCFSAA